MSNPAPRRGCFSSCASFIGWTVIIIVAIVVLIVLAPVPSTSGSTSHTPARATSPASAPPGATATRIPTTPLELCEYFARRDATSDLAVESVVVNTSESKDYLVVTCKLDVLRDPDDYIRAAVKFMLAVAEPMATRGSFDVMTFVFNGPFVDKYGNDVTLVGARAMCELATLRKINFDHFADYLYVDPYAYFRACDTYFIHPAWQAE